MPGNEAGDPAEGVAFLGSGTGPTTAVVPPNAGTAVAVTGCGLCASLIVLIIGLLGAGDQCDKPLSNFLVVLATVQIISSCGVFCFMMQSQKILEGTGTKDTVNFIGCCCILPSTIFCFGWNIYGVLLAFSSKQCSARLYYTAMIYVWYWLIETCCNVCSGMQMYKAGRESGAPNGPKATSAPKKGEEEIYAIANSV